MRVIGWCPCGDDVVEQPPSAELDHGATHQGVGGQRVGAVPTAVDDEHALPGASEKHRRCGAGGTCSDDDHVVVALGSVW